VAGRAVPGGRHRAPARPDPGRSSCRRQPSSCVRTLAHSGMSESATNTQHREWPGRCVNTPGPGHREEPSMPDETVSNLGELVAAVRLAQSDMHTACSVWHVARAHRADELDDTSRALVEAIDRVQAAVEALREANREAGL